PGGWHDPNFSVIKFLSARFGFFLFSLLFLGSGSVFLWLYWLLALSPPKRTITQEEALELSKPAGKGKTSEERYVRSSDSSEFFGIRWRNDLVKPISGSPRWIVFVCKYPFSFLIPSLFLFCYAYFWHRWISEWESGETETLYLGKLKLLHDLFGIWGVVGFYLLIGAGFLWLFWYYAVRESE
ncbi:hypothetical protein, partial [Leptospira ellisii]|uniref:hypothetical protein n=1 Tax=Leptospira ellisii TaxID=2023197 RepID=UPI000CB67DBC